MKVLQTKPHLSDKELRKMLNCQKDVRSFRDWQVIYCVQTNYGKKAIEIADMLGVTVSKIYRVIQFYNRQGKTWRENKEWGGRREERCNLSLKEEKEILKEVESQALKGYILTYKQVKVKIEKKVGRQVSDDYIWDMFKRHNWVKKVPRQSHPKSDRKKQEDYKKNSKKIWQPNH